MPTLILANLEQGAEVTTGYSQYFFNAWKYLLPHDFTKIQKFRDFMAHQPYDLALFTEDSNMSGTSTLLGQFITNKPTIIRWQNSWGEGVSIYGDQPQDVSIKTNAINLCNNRGLIIAELPDYIIALTHLSLLSRAKRIKQVREIASELDNYSKPTILCGDFNDTSLSIPGFQHIKIPGTYPSWKPNKALLNVYIKGNAKVKEVEILPIKFSDHLGLILTIE